MITSLEEIHLSNPANEIILFPNPATNQVELKFDSQNIEWSIMSLNGLLLSKGNMNREDSNNKIDISTLNPGMYLIEIQSGSFHCEKEIHKRVIILKRPKAYL